MYTKRSKWNDKYYIRVYELAKIGHADNTICKQLGVGRKAFHTWVEEKPALRDCLDRARRINEEEGTFRDYVYKRLSPDMQELWEKINRCEEARNGIERIEQLLVNSGKTARQHLFLYALVHSSFNQSEACRKVNISFRTLQQWIELDPEFAKLVDEIHWHKGNFFEEALVRNVADGEASAVIFVNKTFNRDRGYAEKVSIDINKKVSHEHVHDHRVVLDVDTMPLELKKLVLAHMRNMNEKKQIADNSTVIDMVKEPSNGIVQIGES